ncbi:MAG: DUF4391 family protein [Candidatus Pacebacteria bacterium]|nr:DUF4391 family protein [Candidatus Paceibacterota bacterium]
MNHQFNLPQSAIVNKFVPKLRFYEQAAVNTKLKQSFQQVINRITWKYKLAEETIGIDKTDTVEEIQIFAIELKKKQIPKKALQLINKTIPYPVLYIFVFEDDFAYGITLKEKRTTYFSDWNKELEFDFNGLNLEKVYQNLVKQFITKIDTSPEQGFEHIIERDKQAKALEREIQILENKIRREKQFNKKVELNQQLHQKREAYQQLIELDE